MCLVGHFEESDFRYRRIRLRRILSMDGVTTVLSIAVGGQQFVVRRFLCGGEGRDDVYSIKVLSSAGCIRMSRAGTLRAVDFNGSVNVGFICVFDGHVEERELACRVFCFQGTFTVAVDEEANYVSGTFRTYVSNDGRRVRRAKSIRFINDSEIFCEAKGQTGDHFI